MMTLVVAELDADGVSLVSDTLLTTPASRSVKPYLAHGLKVFVLHRGLCVAYSGGALTGSEAILNLGVNPNAPFDLEAIPRSLRRASRRSDNGARSYLTCMGAPLSPAT